MKIWKTNVDLHIKISDFCGQFDFHTISIDNMGSSFYDIVVPVYNALTQTKRCIESILKYSTLDFRLILVNDGSDEATSTYLHQIAAKDLRIVLLENKQNLGFLGTANRGLSYGLEDNPELKIILNSDTLVTPGWLEAFRDCFHSDPLIGIASPLSNNAVNLSVEIPEGQSFLQFAETLRTHVKPSYPDIATTIGFCMGFRTSVFSSIGFFDEVFAPGYAEDSDYHFKVLCDGKRAVLVDNCFIYHESHASFSERTEELIRKNRPLFDRRWKIILKNEVEYHDSTNPIGKVKEQLAQVPKTPPEHDVLFLLPTHTLSGGIIVVYEIVNRLINMGMDANMIILSEEAEIGMPLYSKPYFIPKAQWSEKTLPKAKVYVATYFETAPFCFFALEQHPEAKLAYLIQGYEGWFPQTKLLNAVATYQAIPNRISVSKWLDEMMSRWGVDSKTIGNGVDTGLFRPRPDYLEQNARVRILLMLRG